MEDYIGDLRKITFYVQQEIKDGASIDVEQLALDIWLEFWLKKQKIVKHFIHCRCVDAIRKAMYRKTEELKDISYEDIQQKGKREIASEELKSFVDLLMTCKDLTLLQKRLIWMKYYQGMSEREIAKEESLHQQLVEEMISRAIIELRKFAELSGVENTYDD